MVGGVLSRTTSAGGRCGSGPAPPPAGSSEATVPPSSPMGVTLGRRAGTCLALSLSPSFPSPWRDRCERRHVEDAGTATSQI